MRTDKTSRAAAVRWLDAHVGQMLDTVQVTPTGKIWAPGIRELVRIGKTRYAMQKTGDESLPPSFLQLLDNHTFIVTADALTMTWFDNNGNPIHTTVYSVSPVLKAHLTLG